MTHDARGGTNGGSAGWREAMNVLAVRLDNLGDVLMTTPALAALKRDPRRRLTLLASRAGAAVAPHLSMLDEVLCFDAPWVGNTASAPDAHDADRERDFVLALAQRRFDAAVIFTVCTQSALPTALLCRMAGIPLRLAYSRENPYALLSDWRRETDACADGMRHEVRRQLDLVRSVGFEPADDERLSFRCRDADVEQMRRKLAQAGANPLAPYLVVHPGSSAPSRRWPPERFGQAAQIIMAASGLQVVFAAGPNEQDEVAAAQRAMDRTAHISLAGQLDLGELAALIDGAALLLCNNSGPAHLAAALGTPVVVLYALTNPQHTPWKVASRVLYREVACRNCLKSICPEGHHACLLGVSPHEVAAAALDLLRPELRRPSRDAAAVSCMHEAPLLR